MPIDATEALVTRAEAEARRLRALARDEHCDSAARMLDQEAEQLQTIVDSAKLELLRPRQ